MSFRLSIVMCAMFTTTTISTLAAAEKVDNPAYDAWSKFKPDASVKYKNTYKGKVMGNEITSETEITMTLLEVTKEKIVIETSTITKINGMELKTPPSKQDFPRQIELKPGQKKETAGKPENVFEEGTEKIKVAAGEYETKWHKSKVGNDRVIQSWISDKVPGSLVKSDTTISGDQTGTSIMELLEVKTP